MTLFSRASLFIPIAYDKKRITCFNYAKVFLQRPTNNTEAILCEQAIIEVPIERIESMKCFDTDVKITTFS